MRKSFPYLKKGHILLDGLIIQGVLVDHAYDVHVGTAELDGLQSQREELLQRVPILLIVLAQEILHRILRRRRLDIAGLGFKVLHPLADVQCLII